MCLVLWLFVGVIGCHLGRQCRSYREVEKGIVHELLVRGVVSSGGCEVFRCEIRANSMKSLSDVQLREDLCTVGREFHPLAARDIDFFE
jgi:hypothetical protein